MSLSQLTERTERLRDLLSEVQSRAPQRSEGTDRRHAVRVVLDSGGLPGSFTVAQHWQQHVTAAGFSNAVMEACRAAAKHRTAAWTKRLESEDFNARLQQLRAEFEAIPGRAAADVSDIPPAFARNPRTAGAAGGRPPQSLGALTAEAFRAFGAAEDLAAAPAATKAPQGTGRSSDGRLTIILSASGLVSCEVDQRWLHGQPAAKVSAALGQALGAARADLADQGKSAQSAAQQNSADLRRIYDGAMALLSDPHLLSESR